MKRTLPVVLLLAVSGCAPSLVVKREERPRFDFPPQAQPLHVEAPQTGSVVLDVLNALNAAHWRAQRAVDGVVEALVQAGHTLTGDPNQARTQLVVGVNENGISDADKNGNRTAKADVWVTINGETSHVSGSATSTAADDPLYTAAINDALSRFAAGLSPTEVSDSFPVRQGEGLEAANEKLLDGDLPGAVAAYNARLAQVPNDVKALCNLSAALTALGDLQGALDAANRAADADTSNFHANREYEAREAAGRLARTTRVLDVTAWGAPKKNEPAH